MTEQQIYTGLEWLEDPMGRSRLVATASYTGFQYLIDRTNPDLTVAYVTIAETEFVDLHDARTPRCELITTPDSQTALYFCERHDYAWRRSAALAKGTRLIFRGSARVQALLGDIEPDELDAEFLEPLDSLPRDKRDFAKTASFFEATKISLDQRKDGALWLTLSIKPEDIPLWLMAAPQATPLICAGVKLETADDPVGKAWQDRADRALKATHVRPSDGTFQEWFLRYDKWGLIRTAIQRNSDDIAQAVAETIKRVLGIASRGHLLTNRDAIEHWERIDHEFYRDMSLGYGQELPPRKFASQR